MRMDADLSRRNCCFQRADEIDYKIKGIAKIRIRANKENHVCNFIETANLELAPKKMCACVCVCVWGGDMGVQTSHFRTL